MDVLTGGVCVQVPGVVGEAKEAWTMMMRRAGEEGGDGDDDDDEDDDGNDIFVLVLLVGVVDQSELFDFPARDATPLAQLYRVSPHPPTQPSCLSTHSLPPTGGPPSLSACWCLTTSAFLSPTPRVRSVRSSLRSRPVTARPAWPPCCWSLC